MPMFRFWASDRGSDQTVVDSHSSVQLAEPHSPSTLRDATATILSSNLQSPKRRRESFDDDDVSLTSTAPSKRAKLGDSDSASMTSAPSAADALDAARDEIRHQFGLSVLLKHDELRLINQEMAKCQAALEQLRRCHLVPYPVNCPTPDQMLSISSGAGPAAHSYPGEDVPRWAPPFGVVDGPYARHYAKWLIPDPAFDGMQPEYASEPIRSRASLGEDRSTRHSFAEPSHLAKGRPGRGSISQKLQALSNGYPQPKDKAGPCVLKRADGQTVKLVCLDCHRENFSSTQGFINHCRIAHKREFKSHEEAAVQSGQPIEAGEAPVCTPVTGGSKTPPAAPIRSTVVHPFARSDMSEQEAYIALGSRIKDTLKLYNQGKLPGLGPVSSASATSQPHTTEKAGKFDAAPDAPYLSRLMKSRKFNGNLRDLVTDAKTKISFADITPEEESEESESMLPPMDGSHDGPPARSPLIMRMPARSTNSPVPSEHTARPTSSKAKASHLNFLTSPDSEVSEEHKDGPRAVLSDDDLDMEDANLSPNTMVSNNAPSLVSDDGEYDESDENCSDAGASDSLDAESISDVAEITLDDDHEPRSLRRGSGGVSGAVKLRKGDAKHVDFVSPVKNGPKERKRKA